MGVWRPFLWCGCFWRLFRLLIFLPWIWWCSSPVHGKGYNFRYGGFFFSAIVFRLLFFRLQVFSPWVWVFGAPFCGVGVFKDFFGCWWCSSPVHGKVYHLDIGSFFFSAIVFFPAIFSPGCGCLAPFPVVWVFFTVFCWYSFYENGAPHLFIRKVYHEGMAAFWRQSTIVGRWRLKWRRKDLQDLKNTHHYWMT